MPLCLKSLRPNFLMTKLEPELRRVVRLFFLLKMKILPFILGLAACFFTACSDTQIIAFKTPSITLTASGPLFEGANTAQGEFAPQIEAYLRQQGIDPKRLQKAQLQQVHITLPDSLNSDLLSEITLQLAADQVDMQKVAVLNPVPAGQTQLTLQVAQDQQKIVDLLQQNKILLVADANIKKDLDADWHGQVVLEFLLTVKK